MREKNWIVYFYVLCICNTFQNRISEIIEENAMKVKRTNRTDIGSRVLKKYFILAKIVYTHLS